MDKEIEKVFLVITSILLILSAVLLYHNVSIEKNSKLINTETNWEGLVKLGLAPSTESREFLQGDLDTGLRISANGNLYALIQSKHFETNDFGKTFLIRIK